MTTYNTGNQIGSKDPRDLYDNAENLDTAVNDTSRDTWSDRLGRSRKTMSGMERQFDAAEDYREATFVSTQTDKQNRFNNFIASSGYQFLGDYASGIEITEYNQIVRDADGEFWRLSGQVELPYTTTGAGLPEDDSLTPLGDAVLRQEIAGPGGAALVGQGVMAVDSIADLLALPAGQRKDGLRYLVRGYHAGSDVGGGEFYWDSTRTAENDGGTVFDGFVRVANANYLHSDWFGIVADDPGDGSGTPQNDKLAALALAIDHGFVVDFSSTGDRYLNVDGSSASVANPLHVLQINEKNNVTIRGNGAKINLAGFDYSNVYVPTGYSGSGIFFFIRALRCQDSTISGFEFQGTFEDGMYWPVVAKWARSTAIHIQQCRRMTISHNRGFKLWGNLVGVQSIGNNGEPYVTWWPYEDIDVLYNYAENCAENAYNYMGGGFRGKCIGNTAVNCKHLIESASHGLLISHNVGYWRHDLSHTRDPIESPSGNRNTVGIGVIGNDCVISDNILMSDIGFIAPEVNTANGYLLEQGIMLRNQGGARWPVPTWNAERCKVINNVILGVFTKGIFVSATSTSPLISGNYIVCQLDVSNGVTHAEGTATLSGDGVDSVSVDVQGNGYSYPPIVVFSGGGGSGAKATATLEFGEGVSQGRVLSVTITDPGSGYTEPPQVLFVGGAVGATRKTESNETKFAIELDGRTGGPIRNAQVKGNSLYAESFALLARGIENSTIENNFLKSGRMPATGNPTGDTGVVFRANRMDSAWGAKYQNVPGWIIYNNVGDGLDAETTWNPGEISPGGSVTKTVSVSLAAAGDYVESLFSGMSAGLVLESWVSAAGVVTCAINNITGTPITPSSGDLKVVVSKRP